MKFDLRGHMAHIDWGIEGKEMALKETKEGLAKLRRKLKRTKVADRAPIQKMIEEFETFVVFREMELLRAGGTLPKE